MKLQSFASIIMPKTVIKNGLLDPVIAILKKNPNLKDINKSK
jgi:hypothetical protein